MGNRKKPPRQRRQRPAIHPGEQASFGAGSSGSFGPGSESFAGFNQAARKSCSECGAAVERVDVAAAKARGLDVDKALQFLQLSSTEQAEFWVCTSCDNSGVIGSASSF